MNSIVGNRPGVSRIFTGHQPKSVLIVGLRLYDYIEPTGLGERQVKSITGYLIATGR